MLKDLQPLLDASVASLFFFTVASIAVAVQTVRMRIAAGRMSTPEDDFLAKEKIKARDEKPRDDRPVPADAAAFVALVSALFLIPSSASEEDVGRWRRLHSHMTENNVPFVMTLAALYLSLIKCQHSLEGSLDWNAEAHSTCAGVASTASTAVYGYVGSRILHMLIYALSVRQPFRAIAFQAGFAFLAVLLYCVGTAATAKSD